MKDTDPPSYPLTPTSHHSIHEVFVSEEEERTGLLAPEDRDVELVKPVSRHDITTISSRRMLGRIAGLVAFIVLGALFAPSIFMTSRHRQQMVCDAFDNQRLRSNGTHIYKKMSIIVSIDGLRSVDSCNFQLKCADVAFG